MVAIRKLTEADILPLHAAVVQSAAALIPWMIWCHENYSVAEVKAFIQMTEQGWTNGSEYHFAIVDPATDNILGSVALNQINRQYQRANLGYWVRSGCTRGGVATAAAQQAARFGIERLGLRRIEIVAAQTNLASCRVAEKAGATREGLLRKRVLVNNQLADGFMFSIVAGDLEAVGNSV